MWLLPALSRLCRLVARTFYRLTLAGPRVPAAGPVLLVANHPNGLLDPVLVAGAARRPVRFLAKAPLFQDLRLGWLMRAVGAIPVYRRQDDPADSGRNVESFRAAWDALAADAAVALFPEGISHDAPALAQLRTGAARIALGAAPLVGGAFPLLPVGIVLRDKETFRSEALVLAGEPVAWDDLAPRGADDAAAVRELTARLDASLRTVTMNVASWEDAPLVETAEAVWRAEHGAADAPEERLDRLRVASEILAELRSRERSGWAPLVRAVRHHHRVLRSLGLEPAFLRADLGRLAAARWRIRRLPLLALPALVVAGIGTLVWWTPYRLTGIIAETMRPDRATRATYKLFTGVVLFALWLAAVATAVGTLWHPIAGAAVLVLLPLLGLATLTLSEQWRDAWLDLRRWWLLRHRPELLRDLRRRQRELAERLDRALAARR